MLVAYDTFLQTIVQADFVAKNNYDEPYRYECAYCGEEVIIAAKHSYSMVPHFRHRSGNNDILCEYYIGKYGFLHPEYHLKNTDREKVEFYFNNVTKCFYIGLRFNETELFEYESKNIDVEIMTQKGGKPFYVKKVNTSNFSPNSTEMVMLEKYSPNYFVSNSFSHKAKTCMIFRERIPSFFKIQGDGNDFKAKLVRSDELYTDVRYFVALVDGNGAQLKLRKLPGIDIKQEFDFVSMNHHIWASVITFINKTTETEELLKQWNYKLNTPETLTLLWPPSHSVDGINIISTDKAFLFSSFKLKSSRNINTFDEKIHEIGSNITSVKIDKHIKISRKNAEIEICAQKLDLILKESEIKELFSEKYIVPAQNRHYLFSKSGVRELKYGEEVIMLPYSYICEYSNGCLIKITKAVEYVELRGEELLADIIKHYKVIEPYESICTKRVSGSALNYITHCEKSGIINSLAKKCIEEGKI